MPEAQTAGLAWYRVTQLVVCPAAPQTGLVYVKVQLVRRIACSAMDPPLATAN